MNVEFLEQILFGHLDKCNYASSSREEETLLELVSSAYISLVCCLMLHFILKSFVVHFVTLHFVADKSPLGSKCFVFAM